MKKTLAVLLVAIASGSLHATSLSVPGPILGRNFLCSEWLSGRQGKNPDAGQSFQVADAWLRGYVQAANTYIQLSGGQSMRPVQYEGLVSAVMQACRDHPAESFGIAVSRTFRIEAMP